jgi:CRP-like cAMP-binding protein
VSHPSSTAWCSNPQCNRCTLRDSVLFAGIDARHLEPIEKAIDESTREAGSHLYRVGGRGEAVFTLRSGLIKLVQYLPDGTQRIVRLVSATDVVGLEALIDQPYQHDAVVLQEASVCRIPIGVLRRLQENDPALHRELMRRWQRALAEADAWLTELSTGAARQRVARLLLRLVDQRGEGRCTLFGRRDMGAMLGITTESASRAMAGFKREGLVVEGSHGFRVDRAALEKIAAD